MLKTILRNIVANWIGFAVQVAVTFFLTPFIIRTLGDVRYGAWALVMGLTGYYGLLDLGFRAGLTQYITRYLATKEFDKLNRAASTGMTILALLGMIVAAVSLLICWLAPLIFHFPPEAVTEIRYGIAIIGIFSALQFPFFCISAVLTATQRYDISNVIGVVTRLLQAGLMVLLLESGYGLIGISSAVLASNLLGYVCRWVAAHHVLPELRISFGQINRESFSEFFTFGMWNVLIAGSRRLISYTDVIVIGLFLPVAAIAPYALAASLAEYFNRLLMPISRVFFPAATKLDAEGNLQQLREMYLTGSRLLLSLAVVVGTISFVWADDFFRLWVGDEFVANNEFASSGLIFRILVLAAIVTASQRIGYQVFMGARLVRQLAILLSVEAAANLILSCIAIPIWGLKGVAFATLVPACGVQMVLIPIVISSHLKIGTLTTVGRIYGRPLLLSAVVLALVSIVKVNTSRPDGWMDLFLVGATSVALCVPPMLAISFSRPELHRFIGRPTASLATRLEGLLARAR